MTNALMSLVATAVCVGVIAPDARADDLPHVDETVEASNQASGDEVAQPAGIPPRMRMQMGGDGDSSAPEFPKFEDVTKDYTKVTTIDNEPGLYTLYTRERDGQLLAELPRNFENQKLLIAFTISTGISQAGVQMGDAYVYWKRYDKQLALMEPNIGVRSSGDHESSRGRDRVFTDRVILTVPIVTMGPGGGPVIDMRGLLVGQSANFFGSQTRGANTGLATIAKARAYPRNVEIGFELPLMGGRLGTLYYSLSVLPENTGYKPRLADLRVGYFTTTHLDVGNPGADTPWVRYINRWKLEKADPKLKLSPPKEPIVFYLEHTIPVRYRRWVREGVLEWNKAFEKVGIFNAIEVHQQDSRTGAHMDKDPEDARYNFVMWTNANMGFAIGPSRVDPRTGQILDADIVMDEGFITSWVNAWQKIIPETAMQNFGPETYAWLAQHPEWDPRVRLALPNTREEVKRTIAEEYARQCCGPVAFNENEGLPGNSWQQNLGCMASMTKSLDIALFRLNPDLIAEIAAENGGVGDSGADSDMLDGVPESFIGPLLKDVIMHEVGHTLGLRHNFKASSVHTLAEVNTPEFKGRAHTSSVMDYNPININMGDGPVQGEYTMATIGAYDYWVIEYGYSFADHKVAGAPKPEPAQDKTDKTDKADDEGEGNSEGESNTEADSENETSAAAGSEANAEAGEQSDSSQADREQRGDRRARSGMRGERRPGSARPGAGRGPAMPSPSAGEEPHLKAILAKVSQDDLPYGTDEDVRGPDPHTRVFDFSANSLDYAESQMRLVNELRGKILDRMVKEGESWGKARQGYELLLSRHFSAVSIAAGWIGGAHVVRDHKGDPGDRNPVTPVDVEQQRRALQFIIDNMFRDEAFGLSPELLSKMTVDKWADQGGWWELRQDPTWPVHDRVMALQTSALTLILNPTTMNRVYDNEFRVPADADALTMPEVLFSVCDAIWAELDQPIGSPFTARNPMVSSLRRNLQREHLDRMIKMSMPGAGGAGFGAASHGLANLCVFKLRDLSAKIDKSLKAGGAKIDPYTLAHMSEAKIRIDKALDAQYIYNAGDMRGGGGGMPMIIFGEPQER